MHNLYLYKEFMHIYLFIWPVVIISKCIREYLDNIKKIPSYPCISYTHFRLASFIQTLNLYLPTTNGPRANSLV